MWYSAMDADRVRAIARLLALAMLLPFSGCAIGRGDLGAWMRPSVAPAARAAERQLAQGQAAPASPSPPVPATAPSAPAPPSSAPPGPGPRIDFAGHQQRLGPELAPGKVLHANEATFDQHVLQSDRPVLVDFYASWCGPCKALAPTLDELAAETSKGRIVKVDIDDSPALASRYGVRSVPSLMVFKGGQIVAQERGALGKDRLKRLLEM